ncbi:MAG: tetratricopeptide repeat protein [Gammaproteobacteria bacterium]
MRMLAALAALVIATGSFAGEVVPDACDRAAANPEDPDRIAPPVERKDVILPEAIALCEAALAADPASARTRYQLARVLFYAGQAERAVAEMQRAADAGYRQAQFVYGLLVSNRRPYAPADICVAERYWHQSARNGRQAARVSYVRHYLNGRFAGCAELVDLEEMKRYLTEAKDAAVNYYEGLLIEDLGARLGAADQQVMDRR